MQTQSQLLPQNRAAALTVSVYQMTACLLFLEFLLNIVPTVVLSATFDFPRSLDSLASVVLPLFQTQRAFAIPMFYTFMLSGILLTLLSLLLLRTLNSGQETFMQIATVFGILTGVAQVLGYIRWAFLVPYLADSYTAAMVSATTQ